MDERHDLGSPSGLRVHRPRSGVTLVQMSGDLDSAAAPELRRLLATAEPGPRIVLDLARVTSIDADGVEALLTVDESVCAGGGSVELLAPSPAVLLLLHAVAASEPPPPRVQR